MVGIRSFPFGSLPIFRGGKLLVSGCRASLPWWAWGLFTQSYSRLIFASGNSWAKRSQLQPSNAIPAEAFSKIRTCHRVVFWPKLAALPVSYPCYPMLMYQLYTFLDPILSSIRNLPVAPWVSGRQCSLAPLLPPGLPRTCRLLKNLWRNWPLQAWRLFTWCTFKRSYKQPSNPNIYGCFQK